MKIIGVSSKGARVSSNLGKMLLAKQFERGLERDRERELVRG